MHMVIGFQGEPGAFSEEAALALLGQVETRGYPAFDDLLAAVAAAHVSHGLLPCENSIAGAITRAYDLLAEYPSVRIAGETVLRVEQCLIGLPDADVERLESVHSHPVALEQCRRFLAAHPHLHPQAAADTAGSVREIVERGDVRAAAIGPALAAERYGARVLARGIQDDAANFTRFFLVTADAGTAQTTGTRACIAARLPHEPGSLHRALGALASRGLNLRSLVARPNRTTPFEYVFYFEVASNDLIDAPAAATEVASTARVLGVY